MNSDETAALLHIAAKWQDSGTPTAVAVVTETWNSAPRPVGGRLIIAQDGRFAGAVSGGCVEKEVMVAAAECLRNNTCRIIDFGVADETAWQAGLSCGGRIQILISPFPPATSPARLEIDKLHHAINHRQGGAFATNITTGELQFYPPVEAPPPGINDHFFIEHFAPPHQLLIIGAVHIAQQLAPLAAACEFAVTVIDPRTAWATTARFPNTPLKNEWPDEALATFTLDSQTALITLTHDPKIDDAALMVALQHPVGYIGALGSQKTHAKRRQRLLNNGIPEQSLERLHAPVGMSIGAKTATQIAVSIVAELIAFYSPNA